MYQLTQFIVDLTGIVKSEYELTDSEFEKSLCDNATDARVIVVGVLVREGWSEREICKALAWKQQRVNFLKNQLNERLKRRGFRLMWEGITELLK
jgi:TRAP-type uncharacterized transport system substrate-binding protein